MRFSLQSVCFALLGSVLLTGLYIFSLGNVTLEPMRVLELASIRLQRVTIASSTITKADNNATNPDFFIPSHGNCTREKRHVVFMKVHKAGSSTIANILFRFGISRKLRFLLPKNGVTVALHLKQTWTNIMPLPRGTDHFDILSNHAVYEKSEIDRLFPKDRVIIAILRKPIGQLASSIYYYYRSAIKGEDKVGEYLKDPRVLTANDRFLNNSMAYELGIPRKQFFNYKFVREHAQNIATNIDLVLIMERMAESLVLLKRHLCWELKDIVFIIRNVNPKKPHIERSAEELQRHRDMMKTSYILYDIFSKRLDEQVARATEIEDEVAHFKEILRQASEFCLKRKDDDVLTVDQTRWNEAFKIRRTECSVLQLDGFGILAYAKKYQYGV